MGKTYYKCVGLVLDWATFKNPYYKRNLTGLKVLEVRSYRGTSAHPAVIGSQTNDELKLSITLCLNALAAALVDPHTAKTVHVDLMLERWSFILQAFDTYRDTKLHEWVSDPTTVPERYQC